MLWLYIILGILGFFIILCIIAYLIAKKLHKSFFSGHYYNDTRITYYTKEEFNLEFTPLEIPVDNEVMKGGLYNYKEYDNQKIFVVLHGMWSGVDAYMQDIAYICKKGYQVLAVNYLGTNDSTGSLTGLGNSLRCADYIMNYIKSNDELKNRDIYVYGHSWGGFATSNIPYYHKDIKGICALAPFISIKGCMEGLLPKPLWFIIPAYLWIEYRKTKKYSLCNTYKSLMDFKGNSVIIHSVNDKTVNFKYNTYKLQKKLSNTHFLVVTDKDHCPQYSTLAVEVGRKYMKAISSMSEEEKTEYMKTFDFHSMGELDVPLLDKAFELLLNPEVQDGRE